MTHFDKPLLFMVAANLFAAVFPIAARAETANAQYARMVRLDAQIAAARNAISHRARIRPSACYRRALATSPTPGSGRTEHRGFQRVPRPDRSARKPDAADQRQIEQMQFETRRLAAAQEFQGGCRFPLPRGRAGRSRRQAPSEASEAPATRIDGDDRGPPQSAAIAPSRANGRGDAFDPSRIPAPRGSSPARQRVAPAAVSTNPAVGAPTIGGPAGLDRNEPGAPLDLSNGRSRIAGPPPTTPTPPMAAAGVPASALPRLAATLIAMAPNPCAKRS